MWKNERIDRIHVAAYNFSLLWNKIQGNVTEGNLTHPKNARSRSSL